MVKRREGIKVGKQVSLIVVLAFMILFSNVAVAIDVSFDVCTTEVDGFEWGLLGRDFGPRAFGCVPEQDLELARRRCFERFGNEGKGVLEVESVTFTTSMQSPFLSKAKGYDVIRISGCGVTSEVGRPKLPVKVFTVLLPPNGDVESIELISSEKEDLAGSYTILPVQYPSATIEYKLSQFVEPDPVVYQSYGPYPGILFENAGVQWMQGYKLLNIRIFPVQYFPRIGKVTYYREMQFRVTLSLSDETPKKYTDPSAKDIVSQIVVNPERADEWVAASEVTSTSIINYVIITSPLLEDEFQALADWKIQKGLSARVYNTTWIYSNFAGADSQEKIRNFINFMHNVYGTSAVLLGGDYDVVPPRYIYMEDCLGYDIEAGGGLSAAYKPTDYYYACLDGDWDLDDDGKYLEQIDSDFDGEPETCVEPIPDFYPEVSVGRIPVSSKINASFVVNRIINYEKNPPPGDWRNQAILLGAMYLYENEDGTGLSKTDGALEHEYVKNDSLIPNGFDVTTMYEKEGLSPSTYPSTYPLNITNVETRWSNGCAVLSTGGHGNPYGQGRKIWAWDDGDGVPEYFEMENPYFINMDMNLSNGERLPMAYMDACLCGKFDHSEDCVGEWLLKLRSGGAIGVVASSRISYGMEGWDKGDPCNQEFTVLFWQQFFNSSIRRSPGRALYTSKMAYYLEGFNMSQYWNKKDFLIFNLLGDPDVWSSTLTRENHVSVPFGYQEKLYWCGPAALDMVFNYFEEGVSQFEVAEVARSYPWTTYTDELRRAAHFSGLSTSMGSEMPTLNITGYFARKLGYAAFEQWGMTIDDLRGLINAGYPIVVLTWYSPAHSSGHFRVVVGYNETHVFVNDPWKNVEWGGAYGGPSLALENSVFLDLWDYSYYWGLFVSPWNVSVDFPTDIEEGETFTINATVTYPCPYPFSTSDYPASVCNASIRLPDGLSLVSGQTAEKTLGTGSLSAGASAVVNWTVKAENPGNYDVWVEAEGKISGSVSEKTSPTYLPSYNYEDRIGGIGERRVGVKRVVTSWPMFHHDPRHTGYSTSTAPKTNQTLWSYMIGKYMIRSSPAVADGVVFMNAGAGVYALNATTGALIWSYTTGSSVYSCPAVADGVVFVGSCDNKTYALNATTGALIWSYTTGSSVYGSAAVADGVVFVGSDKVYALNETTGALIWSYIGGFAFSVNSCPAVADGVVFVGSLDDKVYALNETTGALIWSYTTGGDVYWSSAAVADGVVFVGSCDDKVYALNETTGALIWSYTTGASVLSSPALADGKVYVGSDDYNVYCLNATTGALIWSYTTGGKVYSSAAVADGVVFVGSLDDKVYALNETTGALIWSYTTGGDVNSCPAVADGVVFVGSADYKTYAFGSSVRDVALTYVLSSTLKAYAGQSVNITVQAKNNGTIKETFQVSVYYDSVLIGTKAVTNLPPNGIATLTFNWDTTNVPPGNHTIKAEATTVPDETNTANNIFVNGEVQIIGYPYAHFSYSPETPRANVPITFDASLSDPKGGEIVSYIWDFEPDGIIDAYGSVVNYTPTEPGYYAPTLTVTDTEGLCNFTWTLIEVKANNPPSIDGVNITPDPAYTYNTLTATPYGWYDADGDPEGYVYQWQKWDGSNWQDIPDATSNTLGPENFVKDEQIKVICTPYDGIDYGTPKEDTITISNSPPTQPTVDVTPDNPVTTDDLTCTVTSPSSDPDGDLITYTYQWYLDGVRQSSLTTVTTALNVTIDSSNTTKGEDWQCVVTPSDGIVNGPTAQDEVTIGNTPPTIDSYYPLTNPTIQEGQSQEFNITCSDADGDPITVQWHLNGTPTTTANSYTFTADYTSAGTYNVTVVVSDGLSQTSHQWTLTVTNVERDIAITNIITSKDIVGQGYTMRVNVTIANQGAYTETFNLTLYANTTAINQTEITLTSSTSTTITLTWNTTGFAKGNYTISAYATPVLGETDTADNTYTDGWTIVTIPGDFSGDFKVGPYDFALLSKAYGSTPWKPGMIGSWNPNCDVDNNNKIGPFDFAILSIHYGEHHP